MGAFILLTFYFSFLNTWLPGGKILHKSLLKLENEIFDTMKSSKMESKVSNILNEEQMHTTSKI